MYSNPTVKNSFEIKHGKYLKSKSVDNWRLETYDIFSEPSHSQVVQRKNPFRQNQPIIPKFSQEDQSRSVPRKPVLPIKANINQRIAQLKEEKRDQIMNLPKEELESHLLKLQLEVEELISIEQFLEQLAKGVSMEVFYQKQNEIEYLESKIQMQEELEKKLKKQAFRANSKPIKHSEETTLDEKFERIMHLIDLEQK